MTSSREMISERDRKAYPIEAKKWDERRALIKEHMNLGNQTQEEVDAGDKDLNECAFQSMKYEVFETEGGLFTIDSSWLDYDGNVQLVNPRSIIIDSDSDDTSETEDELYEINDQNEFDSNPTIRQASLTSNEDDYEYSTSKGLGICSPELEVPISEKQLGKRREVELVLPTPAVSSSQSRIPERKKKRKGFASKDPNAESDSNSDLDSDSDFELSTSKKSRPGPSFPTISRKSAHSVASTSKAPPIRRKFNTARAPAAKKYRRELTHSQPGFFAPNVPLWTCLPKVFQKLFKLDPNFDLKGISNLVAADKAFIEEQFTIIEGEVYSRGVAESTFSWKVVDGKKQRIIVWKQAEVVKRGVKYRIKAGECISVAADPKDDPGHTVWFGKIEYFWKLENDQEGSQKLRVHLKYFISPTATFLGDIAANSRILFWTDLCGDTFLTAFVRVVEIEKLPQSRHLPRNTKAFYYSFALEEGTRRIVDVDSIEKFPLVATFCRAEHIFPCVCCERKGMAIFRETANVMNPRLLQFRGVEYHAGDYVKFNRNGTTLGLGRIEKFEYDPKKPRSSQLVIVSLILPADRIFKNEYKDERRVVMSAFELKFKPEELVGKIIVDHADIFCSEIGSSYVDGDPNILWPDPLHQKKQTLYKDPNRYWTNSRLSDDQLFVKHRRKSKTSEKIFPLPFHSKDVESISVPAILQCEICREEILKDGEDSKEIDRLNRHDGELTLLDLYSGSGSVSIGIEEGSSSIKSTHACDFDLHAAETTRSNLPEAEVYHCRVSQLNEAMYYNDDSLLEGNGALPEPGAIDFISAGPPCQEFSHANFCKSKDDERCIEPLQVINTLAISRCLGAIIENVKNMASFKIKGDEGKEYPLTSLLALLAVTLGYQWSEVILPAEAFGNSSIRNREIIFLTARGIELPAIPEPTHSVLPGTKHFHLDGTFASSSLRQKQTLSYRKNDNQLHPFVSIGDAISDLKPFEFKLPYVNDPSRERFCPQDWVSIEPIGYISTDYATIPTTSLQRSLRVSSKVEELVKNHMTKGFRFEHTIEILTHIGVRGAIDSAGKKYRGNYRDIPAPIRPPLPPVIKESEKANFYARQNPKTLAVPIRTQNQIQGYHQGPQIHYEQNRIISVREKARLMGMPDWMTPGSGSIDQQLRIIGNSVPLPLGIAIGREFDKSIRKLRLEPNGLIEARKRAQRYLKIDRALSGKFGVNGLNTSLKPVPVEKTWVTIDLTKCDDDKDDDAWEEEEPEDNDDFRV